MYRNLPEHDAAAVQAELRKAIAEYRQQQAITSQSLKSGKGARSEGGRMTGLEIPFSTNVPHGTTALNPLNGTTSFVNYVPSTEQKMYVGLAFKGFTVEWEHFHEKDAQSGYLPKTRIQQRDDVMKTYYQECNWYAIGNGSGALAVITNVSGGNLTLAYDNTARGRSKGSVRLAISTNTAAGKRVLYQSYNTSTGALGATFYITAKANATSAAVTITDGGTITAGEIIVKFGHYNLVEYGLGYHMSNAVRWYQGAYTGTHPFLKSSRVDGAGGVPTPTLIDTMKMSAQTDANSVDAANRRVFHLTIPNYRTLGAFGYDLRQEKGDAMTTYGLPQYYKDGDSDFILDMDMEDCEIFMRDRKSYFYYRQEELTEISEGKQQYVGTYLVGSTEKYQNWGEAFNLAWDGRGDDGKGKMGSANSSVYCDNLAMPSTTQVSKGISLV